jgi:Predicted Zn-dependent hydrolases of the beta-lactamase fold
VALLPIGAYKPWSVFGHHMTPQDCVKAMQVLNARYMIPIHWGTFKLSFEAIDEPIKWLKQSAMSAGIERSIIILNPGEHFTII